jgi:hypothetical protein
MLRNGKFRKISGPKEDEERRKEKLIMRSFVISIPYEILLL